ncbi:MAG: hypothetical protein LE180_05825 [Endomicrobium sp.]|uniref:hypothetical protein n=1 Tax=Candidatus Endomicrobiellum pyrsonymphae TaxID=1408203 RepID=UPI003584B2E1|nr:hypothetical protein [Endomicrobium sp.]
MMTLLLKGRHNMMTLRLKRCVSLFVCFSLLFSACSSDKSHKVNGFARNTKVEEVKMTEREKEKRYVPQSPTTFCDKHKWCSVPRDAWGTITSDREIGNVLGLSITPKRITYTATSRRTRQPENERPGLSGAATQVADARVQAVEARLVEAKANATGAEATAEAARKVAIALKMDGSAVMLGGVVRVLVNAARVVNAAASEGKSKVLKVATVKTLRLAEALERNVEHLS